MVAITREMVEQRLIELRTEQMKRLSESSAILGRIQECEMLLIVLDKPEEAEVVPPPPSSPPPPTPPVDIEEARKKK